jgi:hypothetical protein
MISLRVVVVIADGLCKMLSVGVVLRLPRRLRDFTLTLKKGASNIVHIVPITDCFLGYTSDTLRECFHS